MSYKIIFKHARSGASPDPCQWGGVEVIDCRQKVIHCRQQQKSRAFNPNLFACRARSKPSLHFGKDFNLKTSCSAAI